MKTPLLISALLTAAAIQGQTVLIDESFDSYAEGTGMTANDPAHWALWTGAEDQEITTDVAQSGFNSLACISDNAADGGPGDLLLLLGDKTGGIFDLSWSMYIPAGKGGYFNIQHAEDVSTPSFAAEVILQGDTVTVTVDNTDLTGTYVSDEWFDILINVDLDNAGAALFVNAEPIATWAFDTETGGASAPSQLGAIDFYSYGGGTDTGAYYIDDVRYVQTAGGIGMDEPSAPIIHVFPNPALDVLMMTTPEPLSQQASVRLVDATGRLVATPVSISRTSLRFSVGGLTPGIYCVEVTDGGQRTVERVVKN